MAGERRSIEEAIAAQERLRGTVPDEVVEVAIAALRSQVGVPDASTPTERRRLATVLFADVVGFTAMSEELDPEIVARMMNELWVAVDGAIEARGGTVDKHIGDAVMGVWGTDAAREDDPERAVRAALEVRDRFVSFREDHHLPVNIRVGVNTGPVLFGAVGSGRELTVTGDAVNVASRLEHAAPSGEVLIAHDTYRHVRGVFDVRPVAALMVKGKADPVRAYLVDRAKPRAFRMPTRGVEGVETPLVGRDAELGELKAAYLDASEKRTLSVVTVIGEAGAGKSRLLDEFTGWLEIRPEGIYYLKGRCIPDGQSSPYALFRAVFADRFGIGEDDARSDVARKLRDGLVPLAPDEADVTGSWLGFDLDSSAVRALAGSAEYEAIARTHLLRHLRHLAAGAPVVIALEDIHWADDDSLDLIVELTAQLRGTPVVVVGLARPALLERRPDWAAEGRGRAPMHLAALDPAESRTLVDRILGRLVALPPAALVDAIVTGSDGNPFHIEELVKMLIDDGTITVEDDGSWRLRRSVERVAVPPTLTGVMQARLDALDEVSRSTLQHASVIGRTFWDDAVRRLVAGAAAEAVPPSGLRGALAALRRRELIRTHEPSDFTGCEEFAFKHALLRDAAYETVLLRSRPRLHSLVADWLEARSGDRVGEHLSRIAEHRLRADEPGRAAELLERAALQARRTGAVRSALELYERALDARTTDGSRDAARGIATRLAVAHLHLALRRLDDARAEFESVQQAAERLGDDTLATRAAVGRLQVAVVACTWDVAAELAPRVGHDARRAGGVAEAEFLIAESGLLTHGPNADLEHALAAAVAAAERWAALGDRTQELASINAAGITCVLADRPRDAERWFTKMLDVARAIGDTWSEQLALANHAGLAHVRARAGDGDYATVLLRYRASLERTRELGQPTNVILVNLAQAEVEAGSLEDARAHIDEILAASWAANAQSEWRFGLLVRGQYEIAVGNVDRGLLLIGAVLEEEPTPSMEHEVNEVLRVHRIDPALSGPGMAAGRGIGTGRLVEELLHDERTGQAT